MKEENIANIAGIFYPKKKLISKDNNHLKYVFQINNESFFLSLKGVSSSLFLEHNKFDELIIRKNFTTVSFLNKTLGLKEKILNRSYRKNKEIKFDKKVMQVFSLSNKNYLISAYNSDSEHYILIVNKNLEIIHETKIGFCSWHSQDSISEANGIIMYAEYNISKTPQRVSIYRSKDMGFTWEEVFYLFAPDEVRHWHTLQNDTYNPNYWLATSGDRPEQSRWFLTKDNGDTWNEVTDINHINEIYKSRSLSAHRTTAIDITADSYFWSTDDLMGNVLSYFIVEDGERKASSKFYKSNKVEPIKIEKLTNLGIHGRNLIKTKSGYLIITEAKYVSNNIQIFYIDNKDLTQAYFLLSLSGTLRTGGTYSVNSKMNELDKCYLKFDNNSFFLGRLFKTLELEFLQSEYKHPIEYDLKNYCVFAEHLWFLNNLKSLNDIHFSDNKVVLNLNDTKNIFYLMLGDYRARSLEPKEMFFLNYYENVNLQVNLEQNTSSSIIMYIQTYDDNSLNDTYSFKLSDGMNEINQKMKEKDKYIKLLFRISSSKNNIIELSKLQIMID